MAHPKLGRMALEQSDLGIGQDIGLFLRLGLQPHQTLVSGPQIMAQPDAPDAGRADVHPGQPQLVGDACGAMSRLDQAALQNALLNGFRNPVGMGMLRPPALLDQGGNAADLEGLLDLGESVAVIAHDLAGLGHVAEFLGQLQQGQLPLGTL